MTAINNKQRHSPFDHSYWQQCVLSCRLAEVPLMVRKLSIDQECRRNRTTVTIGWWITSDLINIILVRPFYTWINLSSRTRYLCCILTYTNKSLNLIKCSIVYVIISVHSWQAWLDFGLECKIDLWGRYVIWMQVVLSYLIDKYFYVYRGKKYWLHSVSSYEIIELLEPNQLKKRNCLSSYSWNIYYPKAYLCVMDLFQPNSGSGNW